MHDDGHTSSGELDGAQVNMYNVTTKYLFATIHIENQLFDKRLQSIREEFHSTNNASNVDNNGISKQFK